MSEKKYTGILSVTGGGRGFVALPDREEDVEIDHDDLNTAFHGDIVEITSPKKKGAREWSKVLRVLERKTETFVGTLQRKDETWFLEPDNKKIHRSIRIEGGKPKAGMKALVRLSLWEDSKNDPTGELIEIIGKKGEHETEMRAIVLSKGFETGFPAEVEKEAEEIQKNKKEFLEEEAKKRKDFRDVPTMTIDPYDAKDFDDAISVKELANGNIEIGVHIADVSAYVKVGGAIDEEAQERGTSIYLVDRTIPMLPEVLSNDVCSLNPNEDKLAFSAVFEFDANLNLKEKWFGETTINSDKRFTYKEAQEILDKGEGTLYRELTLAKKVADKERKERFKEGSIAFEQDEVKFRLDENGKPIDVVLKERLDTNLLVEDLMLLANREVARYVHKLCENIPNKNAVFVYRIHDSPNTDRIEELEIFLRALGYELKSKNGTINARDINTLFEEIEGTPEEDLIKTASIRSMAKAIYSTKNIGHFGLAFKYYTHFTSPIRRYPDLMVHRILKHHLDGSLLPEKEAELYQRLTIQSSEREASAVEAERDSIKYKQVEYLKDRIGEVFEGVVAGVTDYGLFIEERTTHADGLLRLRDIPGDYYTHEPKKFQVVGQKTGKKFRLGDKVRVRLMGANMEERTLDWGLVKK